MLFMVKLLNKIRNIIFNSSSDLQMVKNSLSNISKVNYKNFDFSFINTNNLLKYRIKHFLTKEPDTIKWIEEFETNANFWDIGANIGEYSIFAAKTKKSNVLSFEPSFFNLQIIIKNIFINNLQEQVTTLPMAVNDTTKKGMFKISNFNPGHANSSFDTNNGWDGKQLNTNFEYQTMSVSIDDAIKFFNLAIPDYIKIDVDGNEHLVLSGGKETLKKVKEVLIELPGVWKEQTNVSHDILLESGFTLIKKHNFDLVKNPNGSANEIWKRI